MTSRPTWLRPTLVVWFIVALVLAALLPAPRAAPPVRMLLILGPVAVFGLARALVPRISASLDGLDRRRLVALHGIRALIGTAFLVLGSTGQLPHEFTTPAGVGDIIIGLGAVVLAACWSWTSRHPGVLIAWNVAGILDFMNVQRIATFELRGRESEFLALDHLPLSIVPYFVVPLLFAVHVVLLAKRPR